MGPQSHLVEFNSSEISERSVADPHGTAPGVLAGSGGRPFHEGSATTGPPAARSLGER